METIGKYKVIETIGSGGMADVFKVSENGNVYALKLLKKNMASTQGIVDRFNSEAQMLKVLAHPNIVKVYETFTFGQQPAIVMEYLEGSDLREYIKKNHPIAMSEVINIFFQIMDAVRFAHHKGITHRDIKPENVIITKDKRVKLIDFGIAKIKNQYYTMTGQFLGSIVYSSPEQLKSAAKVDHRTDIYSLGIFLYHLIEGKVPYESLSISEIIENINSRDLPRLTRLKEFQPFIDKATVKDRNKRFQTIEEMKITLDLFFSPGKYKDLPKEEKEKLLKDLYSNNPESQIDDSPDNKLFKSISQNLEVEKLMNFSRKTSKKSSNSTVEKTLYGIKYKEKNGLQYITYNDFNRLEQINKNWWNAKGRITGAELFVRGIVAGILSHVLIGIYLFIINLIKRLKDLGLEKATITTLIIAFYAIEILMIILIAVDEDFLPGFIALMIGISILSLFFIKGKEGINQYGIDPHKRNIKIVSEEEYQKI